MKKIFFLVLILVLISCKKQDRSIESVVILEKQYPKIDMFLEYEKYIDVVECYFLEMRRCKYSDSESSIDNEKVICHRGRSVFGNDITTVTFVKTVPREIIVYYSNMTSNKYMIVVDGKIHKEFELNEWGFSGGYINTYVDIPSGKHDFICFAIDKKGNRSYAIPNYNSK